MEPSTAHGAPRPATAPPGPFLACLRHIRGRLEPVVVDGRTDRAEILCGSLGEAQRLADELNRHAAPEHPR